MGGRSLSPILRQQLENLDKDAESRKSAMKVLKSFVVDLDSKAIPLFLAQVSQTKEPNFSSREYTISLYEVLARFHGQKIVPQIDNIMSTIVKTLMSSAGSFPLQLACSKVVPAIARYSIEPSTPELEKPKIIHSLCEPLSDILMSMPDCAASGSALCLKALVECENWRFASNEVVNEVCLKVAGALEEKATQTNSHMGLAMTLANRNSLVIEAYARSIIRSGIQMLTGGANENNLHKRLTSIQMTKCLLKCVDSRSIFSELETIIDVMKKCHSDSMECVRGAASEALQVAKDIYFEKGSTPVTCSNFERRRGSSRRRNSGLIGDCRSLSHGRSPGFESPESQTVYSFNEHNSFVDSPLSIGQASCNFECSEPARRSLWSNNNGGVDVSLKDGLSSEVGSCSGSCFKSFEDGEDRDWDRDNSRVFSGFNHTNTTNVNENTTILSPQRNLQHNIDNSRLYTTPRKLIHSLQDLDELSSASSEKQSWKYRSPNSRVRRNLTRERIEGPSHNLADSKIESRISSKEESSESVLSTSNCPTEANNCEVPSEMGQKERSENQNVVSSTRRSLKKTAVTLVMGLSVILPAVVLSAMWPDNGDEAFNLVPT
ncbi:protein SINE1-like [Aristolochia californica]|uniref:protein SINE1-like n=1 Tax=Aristolochia californica TaxID=171875 RepID=UPI0035E1B36E